MARENQRQKEVSGQRRDALDVAKSTFRLLVTGPKPLAVDGRLFDGLPPRQVPLDELRSLLLRGTCRQRLRDAVWAHLVERSRAEGAAWTVGCVGMAMPSLTATTARLTRGFRGDPGDVDSAVLAGFVAQLATINLAKPRIALRLKWAAYRAGLAVVHAELDAPLPFGSGGFDSKQPPPQAGHPDLVLVRAVADGVITPAEATLIGETRLEHRSLVAYAELTGRSVHAVGKARRRAELRLIAYLRDEAIDMSSAPDDAMTAALDRAVITTAADHARRASLAADRVSCRVGDRAGNRSECIALSPSDSGARSPAPWPASRAWSPTVSTSGPGRGRTRQRNVRRQESRSDPETGVRGRGRTPTTPARHPRPTRPGGTAARSEEATR